jgi:hypothetical protein
VGRPRRLAARAATLAVALLAAAGCAHARPTTTPTPTARPAPDLRAFLHLPVASPSSCPPNVSGSTSGRRSPWVGRTDVSVYVDDAASAAAVRRLGRRLHALPAVRAVYFESKAQAYAEFQRLYTCSAQVPRSAVPASYRLVLAPVQQAQRDDLVRRIEGLPAVASVSCDPSNPCVDVTRKSSP